MTHDPSMPAYIPVDVWTRILRPLGGEDKARAAHVSRDLREASARSWSEEDYWRTASKSEQPRSEFLRAPHTAVPPAPGPVFWRAACREIAAARCHESALGGAAAGGTFIPCVPDARLQPEHTLRRLAMARTPAEHDAAASVWWEAYATALPRAGRKDEGAAFARLHADFTALTAALREGDSQTAETLLSQGLPVPRFMGDDFLVRYRLERLEDSLEDSVHPRVIPALMAAAMRHGEMGAARVAELFLLGSDEVAQAIAEQPAFLDLAAMPHMMMRLLLSVQNRERASSRARMLVAACSVAQGDALVEQGQPLLLENCANPGRALPELLDALLPLWRARDKCLDRMAAQTAFRNCHWMVMRPPRYDLELRTLRVLQGHGARLDLVLVEVMQQCTRDCVLVERTAALVALAGLGARMSWAQYDALQAACSSDYAREQLARAREVLVRSGGLPSNVVRAASRVASGVARFFEH